MEVLERGGSIELELVTVTVKRGRTESEIGGGCGEKVTGAERRKDEKKRKKKRRKEKEEEEEPPGLRKNGAAVGYLKRMNHE